MMNIKKWLYQATITLHKKSNTPKLDAEIILKFITRKSITWLKGFDDYLLSVKQVNQLNILLNRRALGEPIAYLIGEREFWSLPISVSNITLIPRPETEILVEQALLLLAKKNSRILDLGTGTGAISLAIAHERPDCTILGVDYKKQAVLLAKYNAQKIGVSNVSFIYSNWFSALKGHLFHMIVSNPPYIDANDEHLKQGDIRFEPNYALISAEQGLADLKIIISHSIKYLETNGWLLVEHGYQQGAKVRQLMKKNNFHYIKTHKDYNHHERITFGQKNN